MLAREIPWTRQPPAGTTTSVPIFAGVLPTNGYSGVSRNEMLAQAHASLWGKFVPRKAGIALDVTAHAAAGLTSVSRDCPITKPMFISVVFEPTSANGDVLGLWNSAAATAAYAGIWTLNKNAAALEFKYNDGTGTLKTWTIAGVSLASGTVYTIFLEVGRDSIRCYSSGVLVDTLAWTMPVEGTSIFGSAAMVFGKSGGNLGFAAYIYLGLVGPAYTNVDYKNPWAVFTPTTRRIFVSAAAAVSAALTGTSTTATEANIVTGGRTIILTLTGDTFLAAGTGPIGSTANTQALIDGIDSAQAEAAGWDAVVKVGIATTDVVRTSSTVATITLPAFATYNITATETITATIPAAVLTLASAVVAAPTFQVTAVSAGGWLNRGYWWGQTYGHMVG